MTTLSHTATLVVATNFLLVNDAGRREQAVILPLIILRLWLPVRLIRATRRVSRWLRAGWLVAFGPGWATDLALAGEALRRSLFKPSSLCGAFS